MRREYYQRSQAAQMLLRLIAERDQAERRLREAVDLVLATLEAGDGAELRVVGGRLVVADGKDA